MIQVRAAGNDPEPGLAEAVYLLMLVMPRPSLFLFSVAILSGAAWALGGQAHSGPIDKVEGDLGAKTQMARQEPGDKPSEQGFQKLNEELAKQGVHLDMEAGLIQLQGSLTLLHEPLEYLLILEHGNRHEALVTVDCDAQSLNTAMLLTGVETGQNAKVTPVDPPPTEEEWRAGAPTHTVEAAKGDGFYLYLYWTETGEDGREEKFFFRAEDLILNIYRDRTYHRAPWVYLGSRFIRPHKDAEEMFAAQAEGNLVSLCYFNPANHLLTGNDPDADNQDIWFPNIFLLPEIGHPMTVYLSRQPLELPPPQLNRAGT
ncbi:MAG: hypothetical protein DWQ01_18280 [Planctomycetota bacterium]|nr:MAG: hypothetical protein DWQ01_18280 [Planctomycetota bacterium]